MRAIHEKITGISDIDWFDLADECGLEVHPDQLRKMGAGVRLVYEAGMLALQGDAPLEDPCEIQRLRDLRREINEGRRADARSEALREAVANAAKDLPPVQIFVPSTAQGFADRSLVLAIGDFHYGAEWSVKGLHGETLNAYNPEVFAQRMEALLDQLYTIIKKEQITHVDLLMCGDSLDGMLRNSQLMKLRYGVVESCMRLAEYMTQWIATLSSHGQVTVAAYNVDGNHGEIRPLASKRGEFEGENLEKILTWYLHARFADCEGVKVDPISETRKLIEIQGYNFLMTHGDGSAKGLDALAKQAMLLYGERIDFFICAHRHREQEAITGYTDDGNALVLRIPSLCGMDGYAQALGYGGKPGALALIMERGYGRRCMYPIML